MMAEITVYFKIFEVSGNHTNQYDVITQSLEQSYLSYLSYDILLLLLLLHYINNNSNNKNNPQLIDDWVDKTSLKKSVLAESRFEKNVEFRTFRKVDFFLAAVLIGREEKAFIGGWLVSSIGLLIESELYNY